MLLYFVLNVKVVSKVRTSVNFANGANLLPFKLNSKSTVVIWNSISETEYQHGFKAWFPLCHNCREQVIQLNKRFGELSNRGFLNDHAWKFHFHFTERAHFLY